MLVDFSSVYLLAFSTNPRHLAALVEIARKEPLDEFKRRMIIEGRRSGVPEETILEMLDNIHYKVGLY